MAFNLIVIFHEYNIRVEEVLKLSFAGKAALNFGGLK